MPQEVVQLKISVDGYNEASKNLQALDDLTDKLNSKKIKIDVDTTSLKQMEASVEKRLQLVTEHINAQARLATAQNKVAVEEAKIAQQVEKTAQAQAKAEAVEQRRRLLAEQMSAAQDKAARSAENYKNSVDSISKTPLQEQIDALVGVDRQFKSAAESAKVFEEAASRARMEIDKKVGRDTGNVFDLSGGTDGFREYIENVEGMQNATVAATRAVEAGGQTFQQFSVSARNAAGDFDGYTFSVNTATGAVHKLDNGISAVDKTAKQLGQTIGGQIADFIKWGVMAALVYAPLQALGDAVQELKAVDAELVNIQKVMNATAGEMETLSQKAYEVGSALGIAASDYLASVNKWAQAGYGSLSDELGELSVKTQLVGDVQEETANQFLLSVDAAYQYKGNIEALTRVLDGANAISNNYATSVEKLAGGMGIVSSLAAQAGMEVQETMAAIGTITAVTQESGNSAARALRALILNIQGSTEIAVDEATGERWTEDEIEATAAALGDLNIATREYKDGVESLRNPMEVIGELSDKYRQGLISEVQLQEVVSSLGGKVRSNQLQALISNYDLYEQMLDTYSESVGSADRELDIYLNSWEAKTNRLKNQWVELVDSFQANDVVKGLLDVANALMEIVNTPAGNILVVATAMTALNTALKAFSKTETGKAVVDTLKGTKEAFTGLITTFRTQGIVAGFKQIGTAITTAMGPVGIAITAIYALTAIVDWFSKSATRAAEKVSTLSEEYESGISALENYKTQLEEIKDKIDEINSQDTLSFTDEEELKTLEAQNMELERQIALQELLNKAKKEELEIAAKEALNTGYAMEDAPNLVNMVTSYWGSLVSAIFTDKTMEDFFNNSAWSDWYENYMLTTAGSILPGSVDFKKQADYLANKLDELTQKKEEFLSVNGDDPHTWTQKQLEEFDGIEKDMANLNITAIDFYNQLQTNISNLSDGAEKEEWKEVASGLYAAMVSAQNLSDRIEILTSAMDSATKTNFLDMLGSIQADGVVTEQEIQNLIDKFPILNDALADGEYTLSDMAAYFSEAANSAENFGDRIGDTSTDMEQMEAAADALSETLSSLESGLTAINDAQKELSEHGELSVGTIDALVQRFPELTELMWEYQAGLVSEQELQQALSEQYGKTADAYQQSILEKMYDNQEFYKNVILTNTDIVAKLADLGITDLENYESIADLKTAVNEKFNTASQVGAAETTIENTKSYNAEAKAYIESRKTMAKAMKSIIPGASLLQSQTPLERASLETGATAVVDDILSQLDSILNDAIKIPDLDLDTDSVSDSAAEKVEDYYQTQIQAMNDLVAYTRDTNTLLEKEDKNSLEKRAQNLTNVLAEINKTANDFRDRGLADESEQVQELKLLWHEVYEERQALYESLYDDLTDTLADQEWDLDLFQKSRERADRSAEEIAEDCQKIVSEYKSMQEEVADLAAYYRNMGYDETDDLIQDLSDKWWEYQENIESVYDTLTDAFQDYIDESDRQLKQLERTMGSTGQQIELLTQRMETAKEYMAVLQATNVNGINDDNIAAIQDQIWADEDKVSDLVDGLWDELDNAMQAELEKWQDKIDDVQGIIDDLNKNIEDLDEKMQDAIEPLQDQIDEWQDELEDILEPIEEKLDDLNDRLEAEQEALENLVDPLEKQIEGYYTVNPDGTVGVYVPGLNDQIEDLQDQIDEENRKWDEQKEREEQALALQKKELALQEAIKNLEQAQLDLETAKNERTVYTLKDGVWAWRPDDKAIQEAEDALEDAEQAKEDAEQELEDLKEQQAHDAIIDSLEDQKEALEKQKELIEAQIEIYEKESEARQEYLQDQIDFYEKEKEAHEEYYNDLIEAREKEIEAIEDYYEKQKEIFEEEIKLREEELERLQEQFEGFQERWDGIYESIEEPARSIAEILDDIAKYGTPAMKEQVDNITDLLRDMGVALGDFNSSIGDNGWGSGGNTSGGSSGSSYQDIIDQMKENALSWWEAKNNHNDSLADYYYQQNQILGGQIPGATFNPDNGVWYDSNGNPLYTLPSSAGSSGDFSSGGSSSGGSSGSSSGGSSSGGMSMVEVADRIDELRLQAGTGSMTTQKAAFEEANRLAVSKGALPIEYSPFPNDWEWYDAEGNWLFDKGGVAHGKGAMLKGTEAPELVLSPVLAAGVLNPVKNTEFDRFAKDLGIMFGAAQNYTPDTRMERQPVVHNVDSHNVGAIINGVELGENMLDRPLSEILDLLGIHRDY